MNANYTCQECGSTEMIQAHHRIPKDDSTLICLCAECHSKKHPNVPRGLFFNKSRQPYWENKSASTLAKELGVHARTIYRIAKKLSISKGILAINDEKLIRDKANPRKTCYDYAPNRVIEGYEHTCLRCGKVWESKLIHPIRCAKCKTPYWDVAKKVKEDIKNDRATNTF
jgi:5-methylcytosine-specific restriction endonuclease McrA